MELRNKVCSENGKCKNTSHSFVVLVYNFFMHSLQVSVTWQIFTKYLDLFGQIKNDRGNDSLIIPQT
jgi:hypothetical protein